jgi:hypothetical protein
VFNVTPLVVIVLPVVVAKKLRVPEPEIVVNTTPVAALVQLP